MTSPLSSSSIYDVAISYRGNDVRHARALFEQLRDRLRVFFAEECQEEVVGTDGEKTFSHIFRDRARIVVIFYRKEWGDSPFTRAEEAAIRQRAFDTDYSFCIWVPTISGTRPPSYVPPRFIWADFKKDGVNGLSAVVVQRVQDSGVVVKPQSPLDEIARLARARELKESRAAFINSREGLSFFLEESRRVGLIAKENVAQIAGADPRIQLNVMPFDSGGFDGGLQVAVNRDRAFLLYKQAWQESARDAFMQYEFQHFEPMKPLQARRWEPAGTEQFFVDLDPAGRPAWRSRDGSFISTEKLVQDWLYGLALRAAKALAK